MDDSEEPEVVTVDLTKRDPKIRECPDGIDKNVSHLVLAENLLPGLPPSIGSLSRLRVLDASDNQLASLPDEIGSCAMLEELLLYKNQLKKLPSTLGQLSKLRVRSHLSLIHI